MPARGRSGGISCWITALLIKCSSRRKKKQILAALESLQEVEPSESSQLLRKLGDFFQTPAAAWVSVDFSDWSGRRQELFNLLKNAIPRIPVISFDYYTSDAGGWNGALWSRSSCGLKAVPQVPARLVPRRRQTMRTFKILRIKRPECLDEYFLPENMPVAEESDTAQNGA